MGQQGYQGAGGMYAPPQPNLASALTNKSYGFKDANEPGTVPGQPGYTGPPVSATPGGNETTGGGSQGAPSGSQGAPSGSLNLWKSPGFFGIPFAQTYAGKPAPFADDGAQIMNALQMYDSGAGRFNSNAAARYGFAGGTQQFRPDANPWGQPIMPYQYSPRQLFAPPTSQLRGGQQPPTQQMPAQPKPGGQYVNPWDAIAKAGDSAAAGKGLQARYAARAQALQNSPLAALKLSNTNLSDDDSAFIRDVAQNYLTPGETTGLWSALFQSGGLDDPNLAAQNSAINRAQNNGWQGGNNFNQYLAANQNSQLVQNVNRYLQLTGRRGLL